MEADTSLWPPVRLKNVTIEEAKERLEHAIDAYLEDRGV